MKKKLFMSLLVVCSLFLLTGCGSSSSGNINGDVIPGDGEPTTEVGNKGNKNKLLVGVWETEIGESILEIDGRESGVLERRFYIFYEDGTWDFKRIYSESYSDDDIHDQLGRALATKASNGYTYKYDGKKISFNDGEKETELIISGNQFRIESDHGRYLVLNQYGQPGTYTKYQ